MKNRLQLTPRNVRLSCTWVATNDAKRPFVCVWSTLKTAQRILPSSSEEAGRIHLCA